MSPMRNFSGRALAVIATAAFLLPIVVRADDATPQERAWETRMGQQRYMELMRKGEIVPPQSPLYATLQPIADRVAAVANAQYFTPFHFYLVNERTPNAFSVPGGTSTLRRRCCRWRRIATSWPAYCVTR